MFCCLALKAGSGAWGRIIHGAVTNEFGLVVGGREVDSQPQRGCVGKPKVAARRLPWVVVCRTSPPATWLWQSLCARRTRRWSQPRWGCQKRLDTRSQGSPEGLRGNLGLLAAAPLGLT